MKVMARLVLKRHVVRFNTKGNRHAYITAKVSVDKDNSYNRAARITVARIHMSQHDDVVLEEELEARL